MVFVSVLSWFSSRWPSFCKCDEGGIENTPQIIEWLLKPNGSTCAKHLSYTQIHLASSLRILAFKCISTYIHGGCLKIGVPIWVPQTFFLAKKEILGHPSFETFPHEKNMWSYFVCMFLFVVHRFLQYTMWDFMWNFKPLFFLKQHTYPVHGLAEIVCEIECIYVYFFTRLFWFFLICFRRSLVDSLWIAY